MAEKDFGIDADMTDLGEQRSDESVPHVSEKLGQSHDGFDRYINLVAIVNFGFTLQAGWEASGVLLSPAILNGGPATLVYGGILASIGSLAIAASLGEMASMDPNVGAQYRWSGIFARRWNAFWALIQGWVTVFAWIALCASAMVGIATGIQGIIIFWNPAYDLKTWHTTMMMWAAAAAALLCNLFFRRILNAFETIGGICHVLFFVIIVVILACMAERSTPEFVFGTLTSNLSGWNNSGVCFNLGLVSVVLSLTSPDGILHMIDETKEPRKRIPKSMVMSVAMNAIMVLAYLITVLFCIGDYEKVSQSPLPILEVYYQATKSKTAATIMILFHILITVVSLFNEVASVSRLTWAFARDKGLPFHQFFSKIHPTLLIPLPALGLVLGICCILALVNIGSAVAFQALISLPTVALSLSYLIPIGHLTIRKLNGQHPRYGPFKLGKWGIPINILALAYALYCVIWMPWPPLYPVTSSTMNYAGPITLAVILLAMLDWFTTGKKRFSVPKSEYLMEMKEYPDITKADRNS